jgi:SAM-dependent methyltransferase
MTSADYPWSQALSLLNGLSDDSVCPLISESLAATGDVGTVVDLGCGDGSRTAKYLAKLTTPSPKEVHLVDVDASRLHAAQERVGRECQYVSSHNKTAHSFLMSGPVGLSGIVLLHSVYYMPDFPEVFRIAAGHLRAGGALVVVMRTPYCDTAIFRDMVRGENTQEFQHVRLARVLSVLSQLFDTVTCKRASSTLLFDGDLSSVSESAQQFPHQIEQLLRFFGHVEHEQDLTPVARSQLSRELSQRWDASENAFRLNFADLVITAFVK